MSRRRTLCLLTLASVFACVGTADPIDRQLTTKSDRAAIDRDDSRSPSALRAAKDEARRSGKDILVVLNVSDWESWCEKLREEFINKAEFRNEALKDFVIVELDYPQKKLPENEDEHRRALEFAAKYHITGFPVVLLLDANGAAYSRSGYSGVSHHEYLAHLRAMRDLKNKRESLILKAFRNKGDIRSVLLANALRTIDGSLAIDYPELFDELRKIDPHDRTGVIIDYDISLLHLRAEKIAASHGDTAGLWEYDAFLSAHRDLDKNKLQRVMMMRHAQKLKLVENVDSPIAYRERLAEELQEILNLDPHSSLAPKLHLYIDGNANHLIRLKEDMAKLAAEAALQISAATTEDTDARDKKPESSESDDMSDEAAAGEEESFVPRTRAPVPFIG